jgi:hypothetical protein
MTFVQQITPFTCGLACIESLTTDLGVSITQSEILTRFKAVLLNGLPKHEIFGVSSPPLIAYIFRDLGLQATEETISDSDILRQRITSNPHCILTATVSPGNTHTFRCVGLDSDKLVMMDPGFFNQSAVLIGVPLSEVAS